MRQNKATKNVRGITCGCLTVLASCDIAPKGQPVIALQKYNYLTTPLSYRPPPTDVSFTLWDVQELSVMRQQKRRLTCLGATAAEFVF
jgi:hypothetical protein